MSEKKKLVANLIKSFFISFAWMNIGGLESTDILLLCVFGASLLMLTYKDLFVSEVKKNERVSSLILGALFVVLYALYADLTGGLENKLFVAVFVGSTVIGLFVMFSELLLVLFNKAANIINVKKNLKNNPFSWKILCIHSGIVFAGCLIFLCLNYPGVMTPDSLSQFAQALGQDVYMNHHPWLHTALIKLFYNIGYGITGDIYVGIACYTIFQMTMVSLSIGYAIECLYEAGVDRKFRILMLLAFVLLPYNLIYAVTIWKDILFTMAVLVFTVTIIRHMGNPGGGKIRETDGIQKDVEGKEGVGIQRDVEGKEGVGIRKDVEGKEGVGIRKDVEGKEGVGIRKSVRDDILFIVSGIAMCVLRHNGFYAFVATVVIWLFIKRKELKRYILYSIVIIVIAMLCRGPIMKACGVEPGEYVYNMCIPLQQIGRVVIDGGELTAEEEQWLVGINSLDYIRAGYSTQGADPMFAWVLDGNREYFDSHQGEFLKIWASIGIRHPMEYINAFLDLTMGYWAPMKPQQTVYFGITANTMNLYEQPIISGPVLVKINELITKFYEMVPVYGFMYCMGGYFWIMLIMGCICINCRQYSKLFAFLPVFMLTLTLFIATPLVADVRYGYALLVILPYLCVYTFTRNDI